MLDSFRQRQPGASLWRIVWWYFLHFLCFIWFFCCYRFRSWGKHGIPRTGPVLLISNHQSFLDPIIIGLAAHHRQFYALARATLFDNSLIAWLIRSLNAIPVAQGEGDLQAMRVSIDLLKHGHGLLIFPEGSRTVDGATGVFQPGTMLLIKRSGATVLPVAIEGSFSVWPIFNTLPRPFGRIGVLYGHPIEAEQLIRMGPDAAMTHLRQTVEELRLRLDQKMKRSSAL